MGKCEEMDGALESLHGLHKGRGRHSVAARRFAPKMKVEEWGGCVSDHGFTYMGDRG